MTSIKDRAFSALNIKRFNQVNDFDLVECLDLNIPEHDICILRMFIKKTFGDFQIPKEFEWVQPLIDSAVKHNKKLNIVHPFCYLTIRSTDYKFDTIDEWHVDGFSIRITHLPEQNYIWVDHTPTEYVVKAFNVPDDFDGLKHSAQFLVQDQIDETDQVLVCQAKTVYCMDPYIVHRCPKFIGKRTFIRLSFTPIEIEDCNNTINPFLKTNHIIDGIKDFRNGLSRYPIKNVLTSL